MDIVNSRKAVKFLSILMILLFQSKIILAQTAPPPPAAPTTPTPAPTTSTPTTETTQPAKPSIGRVFTSVYVGYAWPNLAGKDYILFDPTLPFPFLRDRYSIHPSSNANFSLIAGYQLSDVGPFPYVNVLLRYLHQYNLSPSGTIDLFSSRDFRNYHYSMDLAVDVIHVIAKVDLFRYRQCILPYLSAGFGFANTKVSDYNQRLLVDATPRVPPIFKSYPAENISYVLGAGIDFVLNDCFWFTAAYEYIHYGAIRTGRPETNTTIEKLDFGVLKTHNVALGLTYFLS